jgi:hypothetical protein
MAAPSPADAASQCVAVIVDSDASGDDAGSDSAHDWNIEI